MTLFLTTFLIIAVVIAIVKLASAPSPEWHPRLRLDEMRLINPEVIRGMELNTPRYEAMVKQALPRFLHKLALDFAGVKGSRLHRDALSSEMSYRSYKLTKLA